MRVLITGATGLIGSKITSLCRERGIEVHYLTTSKGKIAKEHGYKGFYWNPENDEIDTESLRDVTAIIHLAGASLEHRWTSSYKKEIVESRTKSAALLLKALRDNPHEVEHFVSASGVSVYPSSLEKLYFEDEDAVDDSFVGEVVVKWEAAAKSFEALGIDVACIRIGLVLAKEGGALPKLKKPVELGVGAPLGSGKQWQSWIHIDDVARIFLHVLENQLAGAYNAVAPNPVTNRELTAAIAAEEKKPLWLPKVPEFALKAALGEMSTVVLSSQLVSSDKIEKTGYTFKYTNLARALDDLLE